MAAESQTTPIPIESIAASIVSRQKTAELLGVTPKCLDDRVRRGEFPKPVRLSARRTGWPRKVIADYLKARFEEAGYDAPEAS